MRRLIAVLSLSVTVGASVCVVEQHHRHTAAAEATWKRESVEDTGRYAREQRNIRTKRLLAILCGPLGVEAEYLAGEFPEEPVMELAWIAPTWLGLDEDRGQGTDTGSSTDETSSTVGSGPDYVGGLFGGGFLPVIFGNPGPGGGPPVVGPPTAPPITPVAVPEPATIGLVLTGIAGVLRFRRK